MKIALFESSQMMRDITMSAVRINGLEWDQFEYFGEIASEKLKNHHYDAIITSKQFSTGHIKDIIKCGQKSTFNRETPIFLFTSDHSKMCIDEAFDMGVTDIYYKQELPALANTLLKINQFSRCVSGANVLLVEDDIAISRIYSSVLSGLGCIVHVAASCEKAIDIISTIPVELVITDLNLEDGGQGQRVIRSMRHNEQVVLNQIPIMVLSSCESLQTQTGLFFLGIDDYVMKPALPMQFSMRVVNLIKKYRVFQQSKAQQQELKEIAHFDKLTKFYNRHGFEDIAKFCVANCQRQVDSAIGIMYIDLDNFKQVNDTLGHDAGDKVLNAVAEILKIELREQDIIARWGGDEFVVMLNQCDVRFIKAICARIEQRIELCSKDLFGVTCSIGLSYGQPTALSDVFEYISKADKHMYAVKHKRKQKLKASL